MTPTEVGLLGILAGLVGGAGGIWLGGKGKVASGVCEARHQGMDSTIAAQFKEVHTRLDALISEVRKGNGFK